MEYPQIDVIGRALFCQKLLHGQGKKMKRALHCLNEPLFDCSASQVPSFSERDLAMQPYWGSDFLHAYANLLCGDC